MKKILLGFAMVAICSGLAVAQQRVWSTVVSNVNANAVTGNSITGFDSNISSTTYGRYITPLAIYLVNVSTSAQTVTFYDTVTTTDSARTTLVLTVPGGVVASADGTKTYGSKEYTFPEGTGNRFVWDTGVVIRKNGAEANAVTVTILHTNR